MNIFKRAINSVKTFFSDTPDGFKRKDLTHGIQGIMPCSIISVRNRKAEVGKVIRKVQQAQGQDGWPSHTAVYFGSGRHETVEALEKGMVKGRIEMYMTPDYQFKVFTKKNLTVEQLTKIKAAAYAMVDGNKGYDYFGLLSFIPGLNKIFRPSRSKYWCSEGCVTMFAAAEVRVSRMDAERSDPDDVENFLESPSGQAEGWVLADTFNC